MARTVSKTARRKVLAGAALPGSSWPLCCRYVRCPLPSERNRLRISKPIFDSRALPSWLCRKLKRSLLVYSEDTNLKCYPRQESKLHHAKDIQPAPEELR
ncbi:hypothetical protein TNIN_404561 [Trichonephila inaurata madagascariensis]|uniref:Uncharacterized protein n=1 Tax=Trichonephila inaurata madagascariensis TaxID=2747483 RepID=A0A8X6MK90_9ARAC|nr:hypothetical protein TNIN_404561 [Trichonephila inaurata madagascariensis]